MSSTITKVDVASRILTLMLLVVATLGAQVFWIPTWEARYAQAGLALPMGARIAASALAILGYPLVTLGIAAALGYGLWKRWGDPARRMAVVGVASLVFAAIVIGQASLLLDLAILRVTVAAR